MDLFHGFGFLSEKGLRPALKRRYLAFTGHAQAGRHDQGVIAGNMLRQLFCRWRIEQHRRVKILHLLAVHMALDKGISGAVKL